MCVYECTWFTVYLGGGLCSGVFLHKMLVLISFGHECTVGNGIAHVGRTTVAIVVL